MRRTNYPLLCLLRPTVRELSVIKEENIFYEIGTIQSLDNRPSLSRSFSVQRQFIIMPFYQFKIDQERSIWSQGVNGDAAELP